MTFCRESVANIIDSFEDFLESKGVCIKNAEKTGEDGEAIIFGSDYDELMNRIISTLGVSGIHTSDSFDEPTETDIEDLTILVPSANQIIRISVGTGDNLLKEDIEEGYVDYLNYDIFEVDGITETDGPSDGGMILLKDPALKKYTSLIDAVPEVLDMAYDNTNLSWIEICGGAKFNA